jgi:hypothetical protein
MEPVRGFELEAADFDDMQRLWMGARHLRGQRLSQVAAGGRVHARFLEHARRQRRRRGLAFRSSNCDHAALQPSGREFDLADHRHARASSRLHRFLIWRHARTQNDQIRASE